MERMHPETRRLLRALRVQRPLGTGAQRVLVPDELIVWFSGVDALGGTITPCDPRMHVLERAREIIGRPYYNQAVPEDAPDRFSCSTATTYVFALTGMELDRYAIDQSFQGQEIQHEDARPGDLLFYRNRYPIHDQDRSIGHVALLSSAGVMIHGKAAEGIIKEEPYTKAPVKVIDPYPQGQHFLVQLPFDLRGIPTALSLARHIQRARIPR